MASRVIVEISERNIKRKSKNETILALKRTNVLQNREIFLAHKLQLFTGPIPSLQQKKNTSRVTTQLETWNLIKS